MRSVPCSAGRMSCWFPWVWLGLLAPVLLAVSVEDEEIGRWHALTVGEVNQVGAGAVIDGSQDGQQVGAGRRPDGWEPWPGQFSYSDRCGAVMPANPSGSTPTRPRNVLIRSAASCRTSHRLPATQPGAAAGTGGRTPPRCPGSPGPSRAPAPCSSRLSLRSLVFAYAIGSAFQPGQPRSWRTTNQAGSSVPSVAARTQPATTKATGKGAVAVHQKLHPPCAYRTRPVVTRIGNLWFPGLGGDEAGRFCYALGLVPVRTPGGHPGPPRHPSLSELNLCSDPFDHPGSP